MTEYDVYSVGNALLDIEVSIGAQFLEKEAIEKGVTTLVDEAGHEKILRSVANVQSKKISSGGSAANTMAALQSFGGKGYYSCRVGEDLEGALYLEEMHKLGVESNYSTQHTERTGSTGKCIVMVTPDAERTMKTFLGASDRFSEADINFSALAASEYLYIEGYLLSSDIAFDAVKQAKLLARVHGVKVALTLSDPNFLRGFKDRFDELIGDGVDLLFCNDAELAIFAGTDSLIDGLEKLRQVAKTFVVTKGEQGSLVYDGTEYHSIAPYAVRALDTVGAGDMYAGAFLYAITRGHDWKLAGVLASRAAAQVVSQYGARLTQKQVQDILEDILEETAE